MNNAAPCIHAQRPTCAPQAISQGKAVTAARSRNRPPLSWHPWLLAATIFVTALPITANAQLTTEPPAMTENLELLSNIARDVQRSSSLEGVEWEEIAIVVDMSTADVRSVFGYAYDSNGEYTSVAPRFRELAASLEAYREWLRLENDIGFTVMLFQFNVKTLRVRAEFSYDSTNPWRITPDNVYTMIEVLRPRLGKAS